MKHAVQAAKALLSEEAADELVAETMQKQKGHKHAQLSD
jgi:hypothetical protein